jgi:iron(III) transport system permease protein
LLTALALLVALVSMIPLFFVVIYTISIGWDEAWSLVVRPRVGELLGNTMKLMAGAVVLSAVLAVTAAWLVERTNLPLRKFWNALMVAPLAIPAFVNGYAWVSATSSVEGLGGAVLIVSLSYYPFIYLPVAAALRGLDPALEESSYALGVSSFRTFWRVVVPQLWPALLGGVLLVALHLMAEFGALQMLRFPTFTTAIYDQYRSSFNGPAANMLASVLAVIGLVLLVAEIRLSGNRRYSRVGGGSKRRLKPRELGKFTLPSLLFMVSLVSASVVVPVASLVHWFVVGSSASLPVGDLVRATATSLGLGLVAAVVSVAAAMPVVWLSVRRRSWYSRLLERSTFVSTAFPGIVVALALITASIRWAEGIYQTTALLIIAYVILFLPRAIVSARAALLQAPPVLEDVARSLGSSSLQTFRRVTLPVIAPGVGAGAALVFLAATTELTATLLLAPIGTNTLATQFWSNSSAAAYGAAAPYAMLLVLISLPATYLLTREAKQSSLT